MDDLRTDAQLLEASADDPEAFGVFYDRHVNTVIGFFVRRTGWHRMAADLTAETFAAAFISRRRYRDTGAPTLSWLLAIARHQLGTALRKERVEMRARRRLGVERLELDDESFQRMEELGELEDLRASSTRRSKASRRRSLPRCRCACCASCRTPRLPNVSAAAKARPVCALPEA